MPLLYILNTFCEKTGYDPVDDRALCLKVINRAAKELYENQDLPGSLMEAVFQVPPDNVIALPYFVGEVRAMSEYYSEAKVELKDMVPRYSYNPVPEKFRVWRLLRKSPIQVTISNSSVLLTLTLGGVEASAVVITIIGQTTSQNRAVDVITIPAGQTVANATKYFTDIYSITKSATNTYNVTITGQNSSNATITLAVIPNDRLESAYTLLDVSKLPSGGENGSSNRYVQVLFKQPLFSLNNDGDCFPAPGFDDAVVYKALEHECASKADGGASALGWYQKCQQFIYNKVVDSNGATQKELVFHPNAYFGLYPRFAYRGSAVGRRIWPIRS